MKSIKEIHKAIAANKTTKITPEVIEAVKQLQEIISDELHHRILNLKKDLIDKRNDAISNQDREQFIIHNKEVAELEETQSKVSNLWRACMLFDTNIPH